MSKDTKTAIGRQRWRLLALASSGVGVGYLAGLSVSPVGSTLVASLTAALISLAAALAGLHSADGDSGLMDRLAKTRLDPLPLTLVILGLVPGTILGISSRTHAVLSPASPTLADLEIAFPGVERQRLAERLLNHLYPLPPDQGQPSVVAAGSGEKSTVLFTASSEECARFLVKNGADLRAEMRTSVTSESARKFADEVDDPAALAAAVSIFLCRPEQ